MKRGAPQLAPGTKRVRVITYKIVKKTVKQVERPYVLFGEWLREARWDMGWNQQELADKACYSRGGIANIETGRQRVLLGDIFTFAKLLKSDPAKIFARVNR